MIEFFYDPQGGALCQNEKGLTFFLQGLPPARPLGRTIPPAPVRPEPPAAPRPGAGRPSPAMRAANWGVPR